MAKTKGVGGSGALAVDVSERAVKVDYYEVAIGHSFPSAEVQSGCLTMRCASDGFD